MHNTCNVFIVIITNTIFLIEWSYLFIQTYSNKNSLIQLFLQILASLLLKRHVISETEGSQEVKDTIKDKNSLNNFEMNFKSDKFWSSNNDSIKVENDSTSQKDANKYIIEEGKALMIYI